MNDLNTDTANSKIAELQKALEEAQSRENALKEELEKEKELNEIKSRFISMASHEFRTPLSTIMSSAYLISRYTKEEQQSNREVHLGHIVSCSNMLTQIMDDFLSVEKLEAGKISLRQIDVDIPSLITGITENIQAILKDGQTIKYDHSGEEMANTDPNLLKHIITNLISNAIKFSHENQPILIRTENANGVLKLSVEDKGVGISTDNMTHLFERFYRGDNVDYIQGTGLGLHIVSKYVEMMNGSVQVASILNAGSTFTIQLPQ